MKFRCNIVSCETKVNDFASVNSFNSAQTSGIVNIQSDIDNGVLGKKHYFCPSCQSKLLWKKMADISGTEGVAGTFDIVEDDGSTVVDVPDQDGVGSGGGTTPEVTLPEDVQKRYNYEKLNWQSKVETQEQKEQMTWETADNHWYGSKAMNHIEEGIFEAHKKISFKEAQTLGMSKFLKKLRMNQATSMAMFGDSVMWGYCSVESEDRTSCVDSPTVDDYGNQFNYAGYWFNNIRIPEKMVEALNAVYDNKITLVKKIWTGDIAGKYEYKPGKFIGAASHWKASKADIAIMNYGINDAMGGHIDIGYKGHIDLFIKGYKELIERELLNGTPVVLLSPFKQATIGREGVHGDLDDRTLIDIYEQAVFALAKEYGIPVIDGNILIKNLANNAFIDFTHFTGEFNEAVGKQLASAFIGQTVDRALTITNNTYLGVRHQIDNVNLVNGACFEYKEDSPNQATGIATPDLDSPTVTRNPGGIQATLKANGDKVVWSFYAEQDGMVVIPSFSTDDTACTVTMKLDFGGKQGTWPNYYNALGAGAIDRNHVEPSTINFTNADLTANNYGYHLLAQNSKVLKMVSQGYHSIELSVSGLSAEKVVNVYGLTFLDMQNYLLELKLKQQP